MIFHNFIGPGKLFFIVGGSLLMFLGHLLILGNQMFILGRQLFLIGVLGGCRPLQPFQFLSQTVLLLLSFFDSLGPLLTQGEYLLVTVVQNGLHLVFVMFAQIINFDLIVVLHFLGEVFDLLHFLAEFLLLFA
jgi:hypothetical protein